MLGVMLGGAPHAFLAMGQRARYDYRLPQATCEEELPPPLLSQLRRDMQHWAPRSITPAMLEEMRSAKPDDPVRAAIMIVNRTVFYLRPIGFPRSPVLVTLVMDLQELADTHAVPDVELVLNIDDYPFIRRNARSPPLPLFSHYQTRDHVDITCPGGSWREAAFDKQMLRGAAHQARVFPWRSKRREGFWQGHPYCGRHVFGRCSRLLLPHLSAQTRAANATSLLNVGVTFYEPKHDAYLKSRECGCTHSYAHVGDLPRPATPLQLRKWVDIKDHGRYRFLLHLDGHSCSWRLQFLLATNSAVLKQQSYFWEYYYSLLQPHQHYVPFWESSPLDVLDALENASAPRHNGAMRRLGLEGSRLAHRLLNAHARQCYWRALLGLYATRLQRPPSLAAWPRAQPARNNWREGWIKPNNPRGQPRLDWARAPAGFRERDDASLRRVLEGLEADLARAPNGPGDKLVFESDVERRSPAWSSYARSVNSWQGGGGATASGGGGRPWRSDRPR